MELVMENLEWVFGGIGVPALIFLFKFIKPKKVTADEGIALTKGVIQEQAHDKGREKDEFSKIQTRILFVDDKHTDFKMVSILKRSGWINTKSVKDITDLDDPKLIEAEIVFVDINGVGLTLFQDQGLGLASALKKKYPNKKIVLYSAETTGDRFHRALREVDDCLYKDAEPYQFINLIEGFTKLRK